MTKDPLSVLQVDHPWAFMLTRNLTRYGVNTVVFITTVSIVLLSILVTSIALHIFQGYIDALGIFICIAAPVIIFPLPARMFFVMFLKLQQVEGELRQRNLELETALVEVKTLSGLLPICCCCKKIRDDKGYWREVEVYISNHSDLQLTHGFCPQCVQRYYPGV